MGGGGGPQNCLFCKGNHLASEYQVVTNVDESSEILKKQRRRFICLRLGAGGGGRGGEAPSS